MCLCDTLLKELPRAVEGVPPALGEFIREEHGERQRLRSFPLTVVVDRPLINDDAPPLQPLRRDKAGSNAGRVGSPA
jgi:hypothetical protein